MNKLSFIFDGKFYTKSEVKIPDDKSSESYVQGVISGIKTSSNKPLTAILFQQDFLYIYGYEIPQKPESVIENLWCTSPEGIEQINCTPAFIARHLNNSESGTEYNELEILVSYPEMYKFIPIISEQNVKDLLNFFIFDLNINFHPDDRFSDYLNEGNLIIDSKGNDIHFNDTACDFMEDLIAASFEICGDKVYDFGFEIQQAKLGEQGIIIGGDVETEEVKSTVDSDQLQAWLKRYNELPEGPEKEVAKEWVISLGGSVETELDRSGLGEENEPETIALANSIINQVSNTEDLKNIQYLNSEIERYRIQHSLDIMQMLDVNKAILNILDEVEKRTTEKPLYDPKGNVVPKFVYNEDNDGTYREFNKKMITGFLGKQIDPSGSADWGGIPVWSVAGDEFTGIFVCIDDNDDIVLLRRDFDENIEENTDNELSRFDEDDTISIEYMLKCMADKSEYNGFTLFAVDDDYIIHKDEFSNDSKELMGNLDVDKSEVNNETIPTEFLFGKLNKDIKLFVSQNSWFEYDEHTDESISFITREYGDVGEESPGQKDIDKAKQMCLRLNETFKNINATWETVDEWTYIIVKFIGSKIPITNEEAWATATDDIKSDFDEDYVDTTLIPEEFTDLLMNFYFAWDLLDSNWTNNSGFVTLDDLYPFSESFDDLEFTVKNWIKEITGKTDEDFNMFSSRYNSVSIVGDLENFNNAYNEIIDWLDNNGSNDNHDLIIDTYYSNSYPFTNGGTKDLQVKINEWCDASIKSLENNPLVNPEVISEPVVNNDKLKELIGIFVKQNSWFADESDDETPFEMSFTSRDYGNVGDERPGQKDINKAKDLCRLLMNNFPGEVKCEWSTVDEWTYLEVYLKGSDKVSWD